jgi:putative ABC transport system ATP-binding protein
LARAFVAKTPVLLADEPTGNLDASTAHAVMELLSQLHAEVDNTIIMITHDEHIARYADDVYFLDSEVLALQ